jgi:biopolymer transport protein ExbD
VLIYSYIGGIMMLKKRKLKTANGKSDISMSSMIDVVFLLLIYFVVTSKPIVTETLFQTNLPGGQRNKPKEEIKRNPVYFEIGAYEIFKNDAQKDSDYFIFNRNLWKLNDLSKVIEENFKGNEELGLIINCGPNAKHQKLIKLLGVCNKAGVKNINIVNDESVQFKER